jgi:molybdenum cofactor cytidylyltransferase
MKLVANIDGVLLIDRTVGSLLDAGIDRVFVVCTSADALPDASLVRDPRVRVVVNAHPERGMFSSIQAGMEAADHAALLVLPADMPFVRSGTIRAVADYSRDTDDVVVPGMDGRRGHPIAIPSRLRGGLLACSPESSLKDALRRLHVVPRILPVDDPGILRDVDVPADLA